MKRSGIFVRRLAVAVLFLLCVSAYTCTALAFFSSSPDAVIVRFSGRSGSEDAKIEIEEKKMVPVVDASGKKTWQVSPGGDLTSRNDFTGINPGDVIPRDISVKNIGTVNVWVKAEIKLNRISAFKNAGIDDPSQMFVGIDTNKWEPGAVYDNADEDTRTWVYYYKNILKAPQITPEGVKTFDTTGAILTGIKLPDTLTPEQIAGINGFTIDCSAASVQADGFDNAKSAFDAAFPEAGK